MSERKNAPVQVPHNGRFPHGLKFRVPWRIHLKAWEVYHKSYPDQSAERLADRGGFGLEELIYFLAGENPYNKKHDDDPMASNFWGEFEQKGEGR